MQHTKRRLRLPANDDVQRAVGAGEEAREVDDGLVALCEDAIGERWRHVGCRGDPGLALWVGQEDRDGLVDGAAQLLLPFAFDARAPPGEGPPGPDGQVDEAIGAHGGLDRSGDLQADSRPFGGHAQDCPGGRPPQCVEPERERLSGSAGNALMRPLPAGFAFLHRRRPDLSSHPFVS